jgi:transcriptional regulator with XRE-family HTH domain
MFSDFFSKQLQTPGDRIKALRNSLGLSRKEFAEKHGFSDSTLKAIEYSAFHLKPIQLRKLIEIFLREGLACSEEWVRTGKGEVLFNKGQIDKDSSSLLDPIPEEVKLFQKHHPQSLVIQLEDNSMSPYYKKQDYVGGIKITRTLKPLDYGQPYIVVFPDNTKFVRSLYLGHQKDLFNLVSLNLAEPIDHPLHLNISLKAIYEIIWYRKSLG